MGPTNRRSFLKQGLVVAGGLGLGLTAWSRLGGQGAPPGIHPALGPLLPVNDRTTGLPLLMLPRGYRYRSMAWTGEKLNDGYPSPGACDGMGVVAEENGIVTLVRNHELRGSSGPIGDVQLKFKDESAKFMELDALLPINDEKDDGSAFTVGSRMNQEDEDAPY